MFDLELDRAQERRLPLSIAVVDCDDLKDLNDRAGHEFGDAALREIGLAAARGRRPERPRGASRRRRVRRAPDRDADADAGEKQAEEFRRRLVDGLSEAGFPLHLSVGRGDVPVRRCGRLAADARRRPGALRGEGEREEPVRQLQALVRRSAAGTPLPRAVRLDRAGAGVGSKVLSEAFEARCRDLGGDAVDAVLERLAKSITFVARRHSRVRSPRWTATGSYDFCKHTFGTSISARRPRT